MIRQRRNRKRIAVALLTALFLVLILWTVRFEFLTWEDLRLIAILVLATCILVLLSVDDLSETSNLMGTVRFNLFFTGLLVSIFRLFHLVTSSLVGVSLERVVLSLKPMLFVLLIYLPVFNLLNLRLQNQTKKSTPPEGIHLLSRREREVFDLVLLGLTNKEISEKLFIAENTVKKHMQNILKKLDCENRRMVIHRFKSL